MLATFLRHGSNLLLVLMIAACAIALAALVHPVLWAVALGLAIFFVSEYTTHRFLLHAQPSKNAIILNLQHRLHYDHHVQPNDLQLLFLPPWFVAPVFVLYGAIYLLISRSWSVALSILLGNLLALLWYEWVHYVAHIPFVPVTSSGRWMKKYHLLHHFKNEHFWFGVTNPVVDLVARTYKNTAAVERSGTVKKLY